MKLKNNFFLTFFFLIIFAVEFSYFVSAEASTTSETITSTISEADSNPLFESVERTYEISPNILNAGYQVEVREKSALNFNIQEKKYSLVIWKILPDKISLVFFSGKVVDVKLNESKVIDINLDGKYDLVLSLNSINGSAANVLIKAYSDRREISGNYRELFDIEVGLMNDKIEDSKDLTVFIKFVNFGEGPSKINIVYSIFDPNETELYRGVDEKVVYTEESIVKNFDFLKLKPGKYRILSQIYYGANQTAISEKDFEVTGSSSESIISSPIIILAIILFLFLGVYFLRKKYSEKNPAK